MLDNFEMTKVVDPLGAYVGATDKELIKACGLIPFFFFDALCAGVKEAEAMNEAMHDRYQFSFGTSQKPFRGVEVSKDGQWTSKLDDHDLNPYLKLEAAWGPKPDRLTMFVYPSALYAVRDNNKLFLGRMD
tara:strand:- start:29 stop:421 length:393 start_codon:yes stop_codon:yes gene_type:complete